MVEEGRQGPSRNHVLGRDHVRESYDDLNPRLELVENLIEWFRDLAGARSSTTEGRVNLQVVEQRAKRVDSRDHVGESYDDLNLRLVEAVEA